MKALGRSFDFLLDALGFVSSLILVLMMLATVLKVALRVLFNHGMMGIDQISGTMMVYLTFLGAAWVLRRDGHVMVDLLTGAVPPHVERWLQIVASLVSAAVCFTMTYFAITAINLSIRRGIMVAAEFEIPRAINLIVIPIGCLLLGIEFVRRARRFYLGTATVVPAELREH